MVNKTLPASGAGLEKPRAREWRGLSLQRSLHGAAKFKERLFIFAAVAIGIAARVSIAGAGFGVGEKKHGPKVATASTIGWGEHTTLKPGAYGAGLYVRKCRFLT
jgi:hypothetical protein